MHKKSFAAGLLAGVLGTVALGSWAVVLREPDFEGQPARIVFPGRGATIYCVDANRNGRPGVEPISWVLPVNYDGTRLRAMGIRCPS